MCDKAERSREEGLRRKTQAARRNWLWERKYVFENGEHGEGGTGMKDIYRDIWQPGANVRGMCAIR